MRAWTIPDKEIVEIIKDIEENYDVNSLEVLGIKYWPLIRLQIREHLISQEDCTFQKTEFQEKTLIHLPFLSHIQKKILRINNIAVRIIHILKRIRSIYYNPYKLNELSNSSPECLFLVNTGDHREMLHEKKYSAEFDPLIEKISSFVNFKKLQLKCPGEKENSYYIPAIEVYSFFASLSFYFRYLYIYLCIYKFINIEKLYRVVYERSGCKVILNRGDIIKSVAIMLTSSHYFSLIFRKIQPKIVFLTSFYCDTSMGAILAARSLDVPTVDLQHGFQGKIHYMYSDWTKTPLNGYELLPHFYWVWSDYFANVIHEWIPKKCTAHNAIIGGHLWLNMWKSKDFSVIKNDLNNRLNILMSYEKIILVTVEYSKPPILPHLLDAISGTHNRWIWLIRFHPLLRSKTNEYVDFFFQKGIKNVEFDLANNIPLYALLEIIDHHVSYMSTVSFEACGFEKPTTIIHEVGIVNFKEFIINKCFSSAITADELIESIENPINNYNFVKKILNVNPAASDEAINTIFIKAGIRSQYDQYK
ncbi:hypothetical protein [Methanocalculus sp. MC3]